MSPRALASVLSFAASSVLALTLLAGCSSQAGNVGEDDSETSDSSALSSGVSVGETLAATANLNLRSGPSTSNAVLTVIPDGADVTVVSASHSGGFYNIRYNGESGWSSGLYLRQVSAGGGSGGDTGSGGGTHVGTGANTEVQRALEWVSADMPYCGGPNGGHDAICGGTCSRRGAANNPAWNAYRSDCSGLVSWAWGLAAPGSTTAGFAPFSGGNSYVISADGLAPGDALNSVPEEHIILFAGWVDRASGKARIIEESTCGKLATDHVLTLQTSGTSVTIPDWFPHNYRAIRHR